MTGASTAGAGRKPLHLRRPDGHRPRLLLAEDSDPVRIVTAAMLRGMGCEVEAVVHGEQAVRQAAEHPFDVIVLDIEMPVMDGITAARSIRRLGGIADGTPLMALSAFLADSFRTGDWRDTFDIALPKPTNRRELHGAITAALDWRRTGPAPIAAPEPPPIIDRDAFAVMQSGLASCIWQELLNQACRDIEVCTRQLEHALILGRRDAVLTFAGKLIDLAETFAAPRLALMARHVRSAEDDGLPGTAIARLRAVAMDTVRAFRQHGS